MEALFLSSKGYAANASPSCFVLLGDILECYCPLLFFIKIYELLPNLLETGGMYAPTGVLEMLCDLL